MWPKNCTSSLQPGWMTASGGFPVSGRNNSNIRNQTTTHGLKLANWNVRSLLDRDTRPERQTALVAKTLAAYDIDIAALSETRLSGEGSLNEVGQGYTFFWRGVPDGHPRIHGVGFAIKNSIVRSLTELPVGYSERLMTVRIPLVKSNYLTLISAYAPTLVATEESKDEFYSLLESTLQTVDQRDKLVMMGDFNARVGKDHVVWQGVIGKHGTGNMNPNGLRFLTLCQEFGLQITNTMFQSQDKYKNTWRHPRSGHWHMIDHVALRKRDAKECRITRVMRGAECGTDHRMQRTVLSVKVRPPLPKRGMTSRKLNLNRLKSEDCSVALREQTATVLESLPISSSTSLSEAWSIAVEKIGNVATAVLGHQSKRHRDWFNENDAELTKSVQNKNVAHNNYLARPTTDNRNKFKLLQAKLQRETRHLKDSWWVAQAHEIQCCADEGRIQGFYEAIKRVNGPTTNAICPLKASDGTLLKDKAGILARWAEYFCTLLNSANPTDPSAIDELPQLPVATEMDAVISESEVSEAIKSLKAGKAAGPDGLPPDLFIHGGPAMIKLLTDFCRRCWQERDVPSQWLRANIVTIYKKKGAKSDCGNHRGLSLLDVAGKVLAKVLNKRFNNCIAERILPESQSGFRAGRSTTDMIFVCRQIIEKASEQQEPISIGFVDLRKAFDTVNREMLFGVLERFGCPPTFLHLVKALHTNNTATVRVGGELSEAFAVSMGVKQGCVLAPLLFNVFLLAVTILATSEHATEPNAGVKLRYRCDGGAFRLQRLRARGRVSQVNVRDLQYADDAAVLARTPEELQTEMTQTNTQFSRMGLQMNKEKTEVMHRPTGQEQPAVIIDGSQLPVTTDFTYLGSIISNSGSIEREVTHRISRASAAFGCLKDRVYLNRHLKLSTKIRVYNAIVISTLLYGSETWPPYATHLRVLNKFHLQCLRKMLRITWRDKITNNEVLTRCGSSHVHSMLAQRTLRWAGHVERMGSDRLPKTVFYAELATGRRPVGRPKKRYKDHLKDTLQRCSLPPGDFESLAADRVGWRVATRRGIDHYEAALRQKNEERRRARHQQDASLDQTNTSLACLEGCGRFFRSGAGLASHMRAHQRRRHGS